MLTGKGKFKLIFFCQIVENVIAYKAIIVENQLKELEGNHFALSLVEPSKFQQQDQHMVWQQQVTAIENSIFKLRQHQMKLSNIDEEE